MLSHPFASSRSLARLGLVLGTLGCAAPSPTTRSDVVVTHPAAAPIAPFTSCDVTTAVQSSSSRNHDPLCAAIDYTFVPPAAGDHYPVWADYLTYDAPVPWGFVVHSMEHGAVVLVYDPESAAAPQIQQAFADVIAAHGLDPACRDQSWPSRFVVMPSHDLSTPLAALAWGHTYEATCLDAPSLTAFVEANYAHAPESLCNPGTDRSATGWCP
ncbi:MAG: DUF3105 domain-containing protein [Sandaracinus sp.]